MSLAILKEKKTKTITSYVAIEFLEHQLIILK